MPKTGGTWVGSMLGDKAINRGHKLLNGSEDVTAFGFIREPISWYLSWYNFVKNGSGVYRTPGSTPMASFIVDSIATPDKVIMEMCNPSARFKMRVMRRIRSLESDLSSSAAGSSQYPILCRWLNGDKSYYSNLCECFLEHCDDVGKYENLKEDFKRMLLSVDMLTDDMIKKVDSSPVINGSIYTVTADNLSDEVLSAIKETSADIYRRYYPSEL